MGESPAYCTKFDKVVIQEMTYAPVPRARKMHVAKQITGTYCSGYNHESCKDCFIADADRNEGNRYFREL